MRAAGPSCAQVVTTANRDVTVDWAARMSAIIGMPVEVRPFAGLSS